MKKVICLYRVSTKKQTNREEDIPVQRKACAEYIETHNRQFGDWELFAEIVEGGVSAYHKRIEDREIRQVVGIVKNNPGEQFVLLAFYSDRISRQDSNGFNFIDELHRLQVEVYTVQEGKLSIETEQDRLMLFIKFWGNNNESRKTANRVDAARKMMTEQGIWTGGTVPYGYLLEATGEVSRKGRVVRTLAREPQESDVVREIYDMLIRRDMTINGIMNELNGRGITTRRGCRWSTSSIKNILQNPVYEGYLSYKKTAQQGEKRKKATDRSTWVWAKERNPDYAIVSESDWQLAQEILARRRKHDEGSLCRDGTHRNSLLLTGLLVCGYCRSAISPAVSRQWSGRKKQKRICVEYYRCSLRAKGGGMCEAKTYISAAKLEAAVLGPVCAYLDSLAGIDCAPELEKRAKQEVERKKGLLNHLKKERLALERRVEALEEELIRSLAGESALSKENINGALFRQRGQLEKLEAEIAGAEEKVRVEERRIAEEKVRAEERQIAEERKAGRTEERTAPGEGCFVPVWSEVFRSAGLNVKKVVLSLLIDRIVVTRETVDIYFKLSGKQLREG